MCASTCKKIMVTAPLVVAFLVFLGLAGPSPGNHPPGGQEAAASAQDKKPLSELEGAWEVSSATWDGMNQTSGKWGTKLSITGDQYVFTYNSGRTRAFGNVVFVTTKTPKEVQLWNRDKSARFWIYELKGDTLTVCFAMKGKQPTVFDAKAGTSNVLLVMKRGK